MNFMLEGLATYQQQLHMAQAAQIGWQQDMLQIGWQNLL
jgi:hypothetical protein